MAGFYLGFQGQWDFVLSLHVLIGTALVAGGSMALNQFLERSADAKMVRTQSRPIVTGLIRPGEALLFGLAITMLGLILLGFFVNGLAAALAFLTWASYLFCYTPLKKRTPFSIPAGAVPGALPPLIGWAGARGSVSPEGFLLFLIIFFWQMPHFLAIAWIYRADYSRAGFPMPSVLDREGISVARDMITHVSALVPASLLPTIFGIAGKVYFFSAFALGILFAAVILHAASNLDERARTVFRASVIYLTLLLLVIVFDKARW
jgi:protoheme IX farnesyltransferase